MNECGEQNSHVHEASCDKLRQELSESLQKVRDCLSDASATSFDRLLGWMSELCAIVAKEGPSSRKVQVPLAAFIQSTNELESSFNFTIGNIIRMCFVKLFIIFFRKCCVDESEKRRLLWIWELRDDDTFNEFARLVLYIGASRKGLIEELIFNMTRCLHDSARFITSEPESFVKTRESLEKISKLLLEMPSNSSPLTSAFGRLFSMAINVALLDNKPIASKTREIYREEFPKEVATAVPLPSVFKEETSDEMTENESEEKRMRLSNKDTDSLPGSSYMADLHEDDEEEDEIFENLPASPSGSQEQKCSTLYASSSSDNNREYRPGRDSLFHRHNETLRNVSMQDILSTDRERDAILTFLLSGDITEEFRCDIRRQFVRRVGQFLMRHADDKNRPTTREIVRFFSRVMLPFPNTNLAPFVGSNKAYLIVFVYNQRRRMAAVGEAAMRPYKKKKNSEIPQPNYERQRLIAMQLKHLADDSDATLQMLEESRDYRLQLCREAGPSTAIQEFRQLASSKLILADFDRGFEVDSSGFLQEWPRIEEYLNNMFKTNFSAAEQKAIAIMNTVYGSEAASVQAVIAAVAHFKKFCPRKQMSRFGRVFATFPSEPDSKHVIDRLSEMGLRQPLVVKYGQGRLQYSVFCNEVEILCGESFIEAVVVALACHFLFHLRFDPEVADIWGMFSLLIGAPHSVKSNTAASLADNIRRHLL